MRSTVSRSLLFPFCALAFALGCASPPGGGEVKFNARAGTSGRPNVEVDASALTGERLAVYLAHGGSNEVGSEVARALESAGKGGDDTVVKIRITRFRPFELPQR